MTMSITKAHAKTAINKYEGLKRRIAGMREDARKTTKHLVRTAEIGGTAFLVGLTQGRTDGIEVLGAPVELVAGGALTLIALVESGEDYASHLGAVGDGAIAAYLTTLGRGVGVTMRQKALAAGAAAGSLPAGNAAATTKGVRLTADEVENLVNER